MEKSLMITQREAIGEANKRIYKLEKENKKLSKDLKESDKVIKNMEENADEFARDIKKKIYDKVTKFLKNPIVRRTSNALYSFTKGEINNFIKSLK